MNVGPFSRKLAAATVRAKWHLPADYWWLDGMADVVDALMRLAAEVEGL